MPSRKQGHRTSRRFDGLEALGRLPALRSGPGATRASCARRGNLLGPASVVKPRHPHWHRSPERGKLLALYGEADALLDGQTCACSQGGVLVPQEAPCCHFALIGREPHPTAVELEEVRHAMRGASVTPVRPARLPLADLRSCPLLSVDGRCRIYASRPFGCRTFFCDNAAGPFGEQRKPPRTLLLDIGRRIADLSASFAPHDPHPRPLLRALASDRR
jgi:hypothetical protein